MNAPLVMNGLSLLLAVGALVGERRRWLSVTVAAGGAVLLGLFALYGPLDKPFVVLGQSLKISSSWTVLGRSLVLDEAGRRAVGFLYLTCGLMVGGSWMARVGRHFVPLALLFVAVLADAVLIRPFVFAAVLVELSAMGAVLMLAEERTTGFRGVLRLLSLLTIGMMIILVAGWMLEIEGLTSGAPKVVQRTTMILGLGFAVLLGVPPFHLWLPIAGEEGNPYVLTFVVLLLQSGGLFLLLRFLNTYEWLRTNEGFVLFIRYAGMGMIFLGGTWAVVQRSLGKLVGYVLMTDVGVTLLAISLGSSQGYQLALGLMGLRIVGLGLWALGLAAMEPRESGELSAAMRGSAYVAPPRFVSTVAGLLAVAGFPLTAGFPGRWALLGMAGRVDGLAAGAVLFGSFSLLAALVRWLRVGLVDYERRGRQHIGVGEGVFLLGGVLGCVVLGIFPQLVFPWFAGAAIGLSNLVP